MHAAFEDYRSGFGVDLAADELDYERGKLVEAPLMVLWGADGPLQSEPVLDIWQRYATSHVSGSVLTECGHYLPEEQPSKVATELTSFFMQALIEALCFNIFRLHIDICVRQWPWSRE